MATFRILEDENNENNKFITKENVLRPRLEGKNITVGGQKQRKTLAVLNTNNNIDGIGGGRAQAQKTALLDVGGKGAKSKFHDENEVYGQLSTSKVPVDQFKAFCVYENENIRPNDCKTDDGNSSADWNLSLIRQPFQEIKNDHIETPMSVGVGEIISPMSIDKSQIGGGDKDPLNLTMTSPISEELIEKPVKKSLKDRFLDIEEYQRDIVDYLKHAEKNHLPKFGYMRKQPDINHSMRTILVDWLVEVCEEYRLHSETLCLAVSYIDRFLSIMSVVRAKLQLVGTAAMFIAAKYEEIYPPDVGEFVYITDNTYKKSQVLRMEQLILKVLTFDLFVPTVHTFINIYSTILNIDDEVKFLATYFSELSLLEADPYLQYVPSQIAASSLALARYTLDQPMWTEQLTKETGYQLNELREIIIHINKSHTASENLPQQAIQEKFRSNKYLAVSCHCAAELTDASFIIPITKTTTEQQQKDEEEVGNNKSEELINDNSSSEPTSNENVRKMISSLIFT